MFAQWFAHAIENVREGRRSWTHFQMHVQIIMCNGVELFSVCVYSVNIWDTASHFHLHLTCLITFSYPSVNEIVYHRTIAITPVDDTVQSIMFTFFICTRSCRIPASSIVFLICMCKWKCSTLFSPCAHSHLHVQMQMCCSVRTFSVACANENVLLSSFACADANVLLCAHILICMCKWKCAPLLIWMCRC